VLVDKALVNRVTWFAVLLACLVIALGAYTRLKDAGLGCPDWPGCYGHIGVPDTASEIIQANKAFPLRPVEQGKAWAEMIHRYFASTLGLLVMVILGLSLAVRRHTPMQPVKLPLLLFGLVVFQGLLGMWTVTLGLFPTVVMGHLLGGFATLSLLFLLALRTGHGLPGVHGSPGWLYTAGIAGIVILGLQIALGGWTAANYAATVCVDLPICQAGWTQHLALGPAFKFWGYGLSNYEFAHHLGPDAKMTIHAAHRIGAILTTVYLAGYIGLVIVRAQGAVRVCALIAASLLVLQVCLGLSNVLFQLPLGIAVAHNGVAVLLMLSIIALSYSFYNVGGRGQWTK